MLDQTSQLSIAHLVISPVLVIPTLYILFRHGKYGILGWVYLVGFCVLRMTGAGLQLSDSSSAVAGTLTAVGLSPLILAVIGVLHESSMYIQGWKPWPLRIPLYIGMHVAVATAVGLLASGKHTAGSTTSTGKVGSILFLLIWLVMVGSSVLSYFQPKTNEEARMLHMGVSITLIFVGIRVIYTVASAFNSSISPYFGPIVYRIIFDALMEYITATILVIFGIVTRNIRQARKLNHGGANNGIPLKQSQEA